MSNADTATIEAAALASGSRVNWLADLRTATAMPAERFDAAVRALARQMNIEVLPEDNRKAIPAHARNGVTIGGQLSHHLRVLYPTM